MELAELPTEQRTGAGRDLDLRSTRELVELMNAHDATVAAAVGAAAAQIAGAVDAMVERLRRGGRLLYVGAGPSGAPAPPHAPECEAPVSAAARQVGPRV